MPRQYIRHKESKATIERQERYNKIVALLAEGKTQMEVAAILGVSKQNVNQQLNRPKHLARKKVRLAIQRGELIKPDLCENCELYKPDNGHHDDYEKPLEVIWLCSLCHGKLHRNGWGDRKTSINM